MSVWNIEIAAVEPDQEGPGSTVRDRALIEIGRTFPPFFFAFNILERPPPIGVWKDGVELRWAVLVNLSHYRSSQPSIRPAGAGTG